MESHGFCRFVQKTILHADDPSIDQRESAGGELPGERQSSGRKMAYHGLGKKYFGGACGGAGQG